MLVVAVAELDLDDHFPIALVPGDDIDPHPADTDVLAVLVVVSLSDHDLAADELQPAHIQTPAQFVEVLDQPGVEIAELPLPPLDRAAALDPTSCPTCRDWIETSRTRRCDPYGP